MAADGNWGTGITDEESIATIHRAQELGVNLLDTSASYGGGHSEEVVGRALIGRRSNFIVASKVQPVTDDSNEKIAQRRIIDICDGSLRRLQTDYIDIYQLHRDPPESTMPVVMDTLADLKRQGKIRWIGSSTNDTRVIRRLLALGDLAVVQVGYNLINRGGESTLALAKTENLGTLIRMPLASGALTGKYFNVEPQLDDGDARSSRFTGGRSLAAFRRLSDLLFLTDGGRRTMIQAALRFVLDTEGVTSVIPGAKDKRQLEENAGAADVPPLSAEERSMAMAIAGEVGSMSALGLIQS
jgi:aryl-alcohol dehydrogenase-like predicted oxidoreductase